MWFLAVGFTKPDALPGAKTLFFYPGLGLAHTSAGLRRMRQSSAHKAAINLSEDVRQDVERGLSLVMVFSLIILSCTVRYLRI